MDNNFQCLNGGIARPSSKSTESSELLLECRCMAGFDGKYCEKDISGEATSMTIFQICLYIFLFLILPSIILYTIRAVYLMLKRCGVVVPPQIPEHEFQKQRIAAYQHLLAQHQQPRPAFRTISLPVNATLLVAAEPNIYFIEEGAVQGQGRRLHRTISWQPVALHRTISIEVPVGSGGADAIPSTSGAASSPPPPPPPPSYCDTIKDQV